MCKSGLVRMGAGKDTCGAIPVFFKLKPKVGSHRLDEIAQRLLREETLDAQSFEAIFSQAEPALI